MEGNIEINDIMRLIHSLSIYDKMEVMSRLIREIKADIPLSDIKNNNKNKLVDELYGTWKDVDKDVFDDILNSRTTSDRRINLDG